jgi:dTDP-glucose pyrophosphorylase
MLNLSKSVVAVILGGGAGSRLYPLTASRSKPAVPIAGKYRLVDIPISNCMNSNVNRMFVLHNLILHRLINILKILIISVHSALVLLTSLLLNKHLIIQDGFKELQMLFVNH